MNAYAWARSKSLFSRLWPEKVQTNSDKVPELATSKKTLQKTNSTNQRFLARFSRVEAALEGQLSGHTLTELEQLWQEAKAAIREEADDKKISN